MPTATVTIEAIADATEGGDAGTFRLTRTETTGSLFIDVSFSGTTSGSDYAGDPLIVMFSGGQSTVDITINAVNDSTAEPTETLVCTVNTSGLYNVGTPNSATVNILDNETPVVSVSVTATAEGSATGGFTFTRIGSLASSLTVDYSIDGTADAGDDYDELSGSVTFEAGADRAEVSVVAEGENLAEDDETVELTIDSGSGYTIDSGADEATVGIGDQPLTISVVQLADGEEGSGNGTFRFIRAGDISEALTVDYTVSGTATSGTDYTALSGSVTFAADSDHTDVTVTLLSDTSAENTEVVTVTLEEDDDYLLANDSDSLFIRDNDTARVIWISTGSSDWNTAANWSTNSVPTATDDVYFDNGYSNVSCTNGGSGLSTLAGLHLVNGYSGTVTLANALSVGTYEQVSGTLSQTADTRDLTITTAMLWSGGTLGGGGADVTVSGAVARLDPPDTGAMYIASTLNVVSSALMGVLPGTIEFTGGEGMYIAAHFKVFTENNTDVFYNKAVELTQAQIEIAENGWMYVVRKNLTQFGSCISALPILITGGELGLHRSIILDVRGHVEGGTGPSLKLQSGIADFVCGSTVRAQYGTLVGGGEFKVAGVEQPLVVWMNVPVVLEFVNDFTVEGGVIQFTADYGALVVKGNVDWSCGTLKFRANGADDRYKDTWHARTFTVASTALFDPTIINEGSAEPNDTWYILFSNLGITGTPSGLPPAYSADWEMKPNVSPPEAAFYWNLRRK